MARVQSSDLTLMFTDSATTYPTTSDLGEIITDLYRHAYEICYPDEKDKYSSDDSSDDKGYIDVAQTYRIIKVEAQELGNLMFLSGEDVPPPKFELSKEAIKKLRSMIARQNTRIQTIQLWGGDYDWTPNYNR